MERLIYGDKDEIVSLRCSRQYLDAYGDNAELMVVEGENHMISKKLDEVKRLVVDFLFPCRRNKRELRV